MEMDGLEWEEPADRAHVLIVSVVAKRSIHRPTFKSTASRIWNVIGIRHRISWCRSGVCEWIFRMGGLGIPWFTEIGSMNFRSVGGDLGMERSYGRAKDIGRLGYGETPARVENWLRRSRLCREINIEVDLLLLDFVLRWTDSPEKKACMEFGAMMKKPEGDPFANMKQSSEEQRRATRWNPDWPLSSDWEVNDSENAKHVDEKGRLCLWASICLAFAWYYFSKTFSNLVYMAIIWHGVHKEDKVWRSLSAFSNDRFVFTGLWSWLCYDDEFWYMYDRGKIKNDLRWVPPWCEQLNTEKCEACLICDLTFNSGVEIANAGIVGRRWVVVKLNFKGYTTNGWNDSEKLMLKSDETEVNKTGSDQLNQENGICFEGKIWCDGASDDRLSVAGIGGICRCWNGVFLCIESSPVEANSPCMVEATAELNAFIWGIRNGFCLVKIMSVCLSLIQTVKNGVISLEWESLNIVEEISNLGKTQRVFLLQWIPRRSNLAANRCARVAMQEKSSKDWVSQPPSPLANVLADIWMMVGKSRNGDEFFVVCLFVGSFSSFLVYFCCDVSDLACCLDGFPVISAVLPLI